MLHAVVATLLVIAPGAGEKESIDPNVAQLIRQLERSQPVRARRDAARKLQRVGKGTRAAIPALKRSVRDDPDARVRMNAIVALTFQVRQRRTGVCPIEIIQAWEDKDANVRATAALHTGVFGLRIPGRKENEYPPGSAAILMRVVRSNEADLRSEAVLRLGDLARQDPKGSKEVIALLEKQRTHRHWLTRHHANLALFRVNGDLGKLIKHQVRLYAFLAGRKQISEKEAKRLSGAERRERSRQNLVQLGLTISFGDRVRKQPGKLAEVLLALLNDKSAEMRRETAVFLKGVWAMPEITFAPIKVDAKVPLNSLIGPKSKAKIGKAPGSWVKKRGLYRRLQELARDDEDAAVRKAAHSAVARIDDGIRRAKLKSSP